MHIALLIIILSFCFVWLCPALLFAYLARLPCYASTTLLRFLMRLESVTGTEQETTHSRSRLQTIDVDSSIK